VYQGVAFSVLLRNKEPKEREVDEAFHRQMKAAS